MRKVNIWKAILFLGVTTMSNANSAETPLKIRSLFDINAAFCSIKTNNVTGIENRRSAAFSGGFGTASTNSMLMLENGENDITIEIGALNWFPKKNQDKDRRGEFKPDAYCKMELTLFRGEKNTVLSRIDVGINEEGIPYAKNDAKTITVKKVLAPQVEKGHLPEQYFTEGYYPAEMELYQFTQKVSLKGLPEWKWTKSQPFTSTPEQILALRQAYVNLWRLFAAKNNAGLKAALNESLKSWSITTGESMEDIYNDYNFVENFEKPGFQMAQIDWSDFQVEVMNKGRMVRFTNKSRPDYSPLSYYVDKDDGSKRFVFFSPIFSLVDGKYIPVI